MLGRMSWLGGRFLLRAAIGSRDMHIYDSTVTSILIQLDTRSTTTFAT